MWEAKATLEGTAASLSLLDNLIKFIQTAKRDKRSPGLSDILSRLPHEGFLIAGTLVTQIEALKQKFLNAKIDLDQTIDQLQGSASYWRYRQYRLIRNFAAETNSIQTAIAHLLDDFVAISHCIDADDIVAASFKDAQGLSAKLSSLVESNLPIGKVFDELLNHARRIRAALGDAEK